MFLFPNTYVAAIGYWLRFLFFFLTRNLRVGLTFHFCFVILYHLSFIIIITNTATRLPLSIHDLLRHWCMPGVPDAVAADLLKEVMKVPLKETTKTEKTLGINIHQDYLAFGKSEDDNEWHPADEILFSKK